MLNKDNYVSWSSRIMRYAKSRPNGKMIVDSIENGPYEIWERVSQMMKGSDIGEQEKKAKLFNEWEKFTSIDGELIESYYHRHVTIVRQTKNLHEADFTQIYDFLKMNQEENQQGFNAWQNGGIQGAKNASVKAVEIRMDWLLFQGLQTKVELVMLLLLGLRVSELGIKPGATTALNWVILLGTTQPGQGEGMLVIFRLNCSLLKRKKQEFNFKLKNLISWLLNCILMANLQQASTSGTQHDRAPVYDTDGSAEVHLNDNCYDNEMFNMFTQEEQYTDLLEPIPEPQLVPQNDNHVTSVASSMMHGGGVFFPQTTKSKEELFFSNVSNMVTVSKVISTPNEDLSDDTTLSVARKFLNEVKSSLVTLQCVVKQKMTLEIHNWSSSAHKEISYDKAYNDMKQKVERLQAQLRDLKGTSVTPHVDKPKLSAVIPLSKKLHVSMPSHFVPQPREFNVVKHRNVIAPEMFKINPSQMPRVVQIFLLCVDSGYSKHMTGNIKLLINFVWKFLGTVR
nr:Gag-Pol polyprotein [Tanacetum cinerariifolium]